MLKKFVTLCCTKSKQRKKGFTLIEMVVVIALLAILALIVAPNITAYIERSEAAQVKANIKNVHTAVQLVVQSNPKISVKDLGSDFEIEERLGEFRSNSFKAEIAKFANVDQTYTPIAFHGGNTGFLEDVYVIEPDYSVEGGIVVSFSNDRTRYSYDGSEYTETPVVIPVGPIPQ